MGNQGITRDLKSVSRGFRRFKKVPGVSVALQGYQGVQGSLKN